MDWSNEPYVRVYTRETDDDMALSWEAVALWNQLMKRFDRSGFVETRRGIRGIAAITRIPVPVVERVLGELLEDGRLVAVDGGFVAPNFIAAQEASKSDRQRQKDSRDRRRAHALDVTKCDIGNANQNGAVTIRDGNVTNGHAASQSVTLTSADQGIADPSPVLPPRAIDLPPYRIAHETWGAVSAARLEIAAELRLANVLPMPARFGAPSEPRGCRDLRDRVREEGDRAEDVCKHVIANLVAQARAEKNVEWLSEKAFTPGGWQTARNWVPGHSQGRVRAVPRSGGAIGASTTHKNHGDEMKPAKEVM